MWVELYCKNIGRIYMPASSLRHFLDASKLRAKEFYVVRVLQDTDLPTIKVAVDTSLKMRH